MSDGDLLARLRPFWLEAAANAQPLPPEGELASRLGVSTNTVREALLRFESAGLVRRRQGAGTFPNPLAVDMPARLDQQTDFADMLRASGFEPQVDVLEADWIELDDELATALDSDKGAPAYRTVKRWRADGVAVMVAEDVIPGRPTDDLDPTLPVLQLVARLHRERTEWVCTWPSAAILDERSAERLERATGEAVLTLRHIGVGRNGGRRFLASEHHVPGLLPYGMILSVS